MKVFNAYSTPTVANKLLKTGLSCLLIAGLMAGCSSAPKTGHQQISQPTSLESANQISAIQQSVASENYLQADIQLFNIRQLELSREEQLEVQLLDIESAIGQGQAERAELAIKSMDYDLLNQSSDNNQARYSLLKARFYELSGLFLSAARERDFVSAILEGDERKQNHELIWQALISLPADQLNLAAQKYANNLQFSQWLQLASIAKQPEYSLDEHVAAINTWQLANLGHPANNPLPANLKALEDAAANQPKHVALMLPLSGKLGRTSQAIRDGFMAAYYKDKAKGASLPQISFIDTDQIDIDNALSEAQSLGADTAIGPLQKKDIVKLMKYENLDIPVLALNYAERPKPQPIIFDLTQNNEQTKADALDSQANQAPAMTSINVEEAEPLLPTTTENLFQFGLAAEDEAQMVAIKAYQDGHRRALVFLPENSWGKRIFAAFEQSWLELGGEVAEVRFYPKNLKDYNPDIKAVLNVDDSQRRFKNIRRLVRGKVEYEPRRREDADFIFMVALAKQARQIKPTLAFNFASDLPVYATSHVFSGKINRQKDRDLNNIVYTETPWLLNNPALKTQIEKQLPQAKGGYSRLYAMGVDAYRLYPRLKLLSAFPTSQVPGVTGDLTMRNEGKVQRKMQFAKFRGGKPRAIALEINN